MKSHKKASPRPPSRVSPLIVRDFEVPAIVGAKPTQIREWERAGEFPEAIKLTDSGRAKGRLMSELTAWAEWRRARRDGHTEITWKEWLLASHARSACSRRS
jgi:predicted DNA-binding transcriptional regulator AlpA